MVVWPQQQLWPPGPHRSSSHRALSFLCGGPGWTMPLAQQTPKHWKPTRRDLEGREATRGGERLCMSYSLQAGLTRGSGCPRQQGWGLLWVVGEAGRGAHKTASLPAKPPPPSFHLGPQALSQALGQEAHTHLQITWRASTKPPFPLPAPGHSQSFRVGSGSCVRRRVGPGRLSRPPATQKPRVGGCRSHAGLLQGALR